MDIESPEAQVLSCKKCLEYAATKHAVSDNMLEVLV